MDIAISPNYRYNSDLGVYNKNLPFTTYSPKDIEIRIKVYHDRAHGWFFSSAEWLVGNNGEFPALMIIFSHLELLAQCMRGQKSSPKTSSVFLENELKRIFSYLPHESIKIILDARNGLFHDCMTRGNFMLQDHPTIPIKFERGIVSIHPRAFLEVIKKDFDSYILRISNLTNGQERENFDKFYNL